MSIYIYMYIPISGGSWYTPHFVVERGHQDQGPQNRKAASVLFRAYCLGCGPDNRRFKCQASKMGFSIDGGAAIWTTIVVGLSKRTPRRD